MKKPQVGRTAFAGKTLALLIAASPTLAACSFLKSIAGTNTVDMEGATVNSMSVDIRKKAKTICPREKIQMAVFVEALLEGEDKPQSLETWFGDDSKNDKLDFDIFAFHSELGQFDPEGYFTPNPDLLASVNNEFELTTAYRKRPDKFTFNTSYKPDYECIKDAGAVAGGGSAGQSGSSGQSGQSGQSGSSTAAGGDGVDGGPGGPGSNGGTGRNGGNITAYATMVKTDFYDELVAIKLTGAVDDFLLFPPRTTFMIRSQGGPGGSGGAGGSGGPGGSGGSGNPGGNGANGGPGGNGGNGGNGGDGGTITLIVDSAYPNLGSRFELVAAGGAPGPAGYGGDGGSSGFSGSGTGQGAQSGQAGNAGTKGTEGTAGQAGRNGEARTETGEVSSHFASLPGIRLMSDPDETDAEDAGPAPTSRAGSKGAQPRLAKNTSP